MTRKKYRHEEIAEHATRTFLADYAPGERLPSENDMVRTYHVSRETVRHARRKMMEGGRFYVEQGRGMYMTPYTTADASVDGMPDDAWVHDAARAFHRYVCAPEGWKGWETASQTHRAHDLKVAERIIRDSLGWLIAEIACREIDKDPWPSGA